MKTERNSVYLLNKCENLKNSLDFFSKGNGHIPSKVRRAIFLSQIDFWDWEVEELIFSFKNFTERCVAWEGKPWDAFSLLTKNKIVLKNDTFKDFDYWLDNMNYAISSEHTSHEAVIAPFTSLNETLKKFNELLDLCENELEKGSNLSKYKKELIKNEKATS